MRPFELTCLASELLTLVVIVSRGSGAWRGFGMLAVVPLIVATLQLFFEGSRWQMVPAYVLAIILALFALQGGASSPWPRRLLLAGGGVLLVGWLLAFALPFIFPVFSLPKPSGPYAIGTLTYPLVDPSRPEYFTPNPKDHRQLLMQIWYPAEANSGSELAAYVPGAAKVLPKLAPLLKYPPFLLTHFKYVRTHGVEAAPVAAALPAYPVIFYLEGLYGLRQFSTAQVEELVSHGFIVVGLDEPGAAGAVLLPDGRQIISQARGVMDALIDQSVVPVQQVPVLYGQRFEEGIIPYFAEDVRVALRELEGLNRQDPAGVLQGKLELSQLGIFGVSLGGIVAAHACRVEPRLKACLVLDAPMTRDVVARGLEQPTMWLTRPAATMRLEGWEESEITKHQRTMRAAFARLNAERYFVELKGAFHLNFLDTPFWTRLSSFGLPISGPIGRWRAHEIITAYSRAFFDKHLRGAAPALLASGKSPYPEVKLEQRGD